MQSLNHLHVFQDIQTPGALLRAARESMGCTQEEIASRSRLPLYAVVAIDEEDWDRLPAMVYVRGFLRLYAHEVGLDPNAPIHLLEANLAEFQAQRDLEIQEALINHENTDTFMIDTRSILNVLLGVFAVAVLIGLFSISPTTLEASERSDSSYQVNLLIP